MIGFGCVEQLEPVTPATETPLLRLGGEARGVASRLNTSCFCAVGGPTLPFTLRTVHKCELAQIHSIQITRTQCWGGFGQLWRGRQQVDKGGILALRATLRLDSAQRAPRHAPSKRP